jgi:hypothetical protein
MTGEMKMDTEHTPKLTCAEIAALWTQYMNETAGLCINTHMLSHIVDADIRAVFEHAVSLASQHLEKIKVFFINEGFPIPVGFSNQDLIPDAPQLFSDTLCLHYLNILSIHGCHGYSGAVSTCSRLDIRDYFTRCSASATEMCNRTKNVLLEKGLYFRPPTVMPPENVDFVKDKNFIAGWFGEKRPLSCIEISNIYFNLKKSILAIAMITAFSQVVHDKKVREFLLEAIKVGNNHIEMFSDVLHSENLPVPPTLVAQIVNSDIPPFSDKLMMFHIGFLFSTAVVYYGTGWSSSPRRDLTPKYMSAIAGDLKAGGDWLDIMIKNGWLEQPPLTVDRKELATTKK